MALVSQCRDDVVQKYVRAIDLFRQFDDDASGRIDASEFAKRSTVVDS